MRDGHDPISDAIERFRQHGGTMRTAEAIRTGIHPRTLYRMRDEGILERLERGLYRLSELPPLSNPDLATVALKVPDGVVCLISALAFHGITTQIPHAVDVALPRGSRRPRMNHPPIRVYFFSALPYEKGVEAHDIDGIPARVYSREKTLADCFKYRRKIGLDVVLEAMDLYVLNGRADVDTLLYHARVCGVENVMRPYLEAILR